MGNGRDKHSSQVGKATAIAAQDVVNSPNMAGLGVGKANLVQTHDVGNQWIDHDAVCAGRGDETTGCFLADAQRQRLIADFLDKAQTAQTNYKLALTDLRVDTLLEKDSDLSWVVSLMLDVAGAHFVSVIARALTGLKGGNLSKLETTILGETTHVDMNGESSGRLGILISNVKDKSIESYVKLAVDQSKKQLTKPVKNALNAADTSERNVTVAYIDALKDACDENFQEYKDAFRAWRNDAEMVAIWGGMEPKYHQVSAYKEALTAKIGRFKKSGVKDIGRAQTVDRVSGDADVYRDTRVIWFVDLRGDKTLWFQSQDGDVDSGVLHDDDPGAPMATDEPRAFGPRSPREAPVLGHPVPEEFIETAVLRSEARWGRTPVVFNPALEIAARWTSATTQAVSSTAALARPQPKDVVKPSADHAMNEKQMPERNNAP